ncbi:GDSL-type esterase/lipase family protein [Parafrankia sp. EAN1pec]|uniref:GDSL-type esterase/lipase family protein n=1 Tax=Parafrankia sp. (strain EAN1pec) TaxID=298653 RepID=UPI00321B96F3
MQRFDEDALARAGVAGVLLLEGINDLGLTPATPEQVIARYTQLIDRAHAAGVKIWLGTITPASNAIIDGTGMAPDSENYRQRINSWIRGQRLADGFVDFDAAVRDPADPSTLLPALSLPAERERTSDSRTRQPDERQRPGAWVRARPVSRIGGVSPGSRRPAGRPGRPPRGPSPARGACRAPAR